ncbi:MAG: biopolymer transporter ExbD [Deltaproteobacteria bacterium]|nr:MAG: biopolymer transporter ExbD [Deltaproteobacteria bacterium]RLA98292.1 MAG: biopolymer transporter ExbD [Deltaproteobacteria bacterium]
MDFRRRSQADEPRIELTPLVDMVFLLLIFFMLSTTFVVSPGIKVDLPKATKEKVFREKRELKVTITKDNKVYLNGRRIKPKELERAFRERAKKAPQTLVIIRADARALHGKVVEVMDMAKTAGLHRLAIATQPKREKRGKKK